MKRLILAVLIAATLSGCAFGVRLPSFDACPHVMYERTGSDIEFEATCKV